MVTNKETPQDKILDSVTKRNTNWAIVDGKADSTYVDDFKNNIDKIRMNVDGNFEYWNGTEFVEVKGGSDFNVGNVINLSVEAKPGLKIEIGWQDPTDAIVIDKDGNEVVFARWAGTLLLAKKGSYPINEKDGIIVVDSKVRNQYGTTPFVYSGLTNLDNWYFMLFPYTESGAYTIDSANRGMAQAVVKLTRPAPVAPNVTNIEFDRVTVTGDTGTQVRINSGAWFDSPHVFTGLTEVTSYNAYAKYKETATYYESAISVAKNFTTPSDADDKTGSPGSAKLIAGDMNYGYFGIVPVSDLWSGTELASLVGITQGTAQFNDVGYLKMASEGKVIFKSLKTYRHTISHDHINSAGCVDGTKQVAKNGINFKVRLMKGGNGNASDVVAGPKGSEWNKLMLPIHIKAKDQSWAYPDNVTMPTEYWGIDFTDADLQTHRDHGNGSYQWCQETFHSNASYRVYRGDAGVSYSNTTASSTASAGSGWSPVLEVIE